MVFSLLIEIGETGASAFNRTSMESKRQNHHLCGHDRCSFNRTSMESKQFCYMATLVDVGTFNRTSMESKPAPVFSYFSGSRDF